MYEDQIILNRYGSSMRVHQVFLLSAIVTGGSAAAKTPFVDGNFTDPVPKSGSYALVDTGERYGSWRVVGQPGTVAFVSGSYTHSGFSFLAQGKTMAEQTQNVWVNLAMFTRTTTGIVHSPMPTIVGKTYSLTFWVGNIVDPAGVYGSSSTVNVYENSTLVGSATNGSGAGTHTETWQSFTMTFVADSDYTEIAFLNGDPPGDMNCGIDNVTFSQID